jgi:hypothetical protein
MSTKRKTLKQKKIKDLRTSNISQDMQTSSGVLSYSFSTSTKPAPQLRTSVTTYNLQEIKYSLLTSLVLLAINTMIFFLIKNSIVNLDILGM